MNKNITTFDNWAKIDKDEKMAKGHLPAVNYMLDSIKEQVDEILMLGNVARGEKELEIWRNGKW